MVERKDLENTVKKLEEALEAAKEGIEHSSGSYLRGRNPYKAMDSAGRYILLDGLVALGNMQVALLSLDRSIESEKLRQES